MLPTFIILVFQVFSFDFIRQTSDVGVDDVIFVQREVPPHAETVLPVPSPFGAERMVDINVEAGVSTNTSHLVTDRVVRILLVLTCRFI